MRNIRIGKDIRISWTVLTEGRPLPLAGRDLSLELSDPLGRRSELGFTVSGTCVLSALFPGTGQSTLGRYGLTLWENRGKAGQTAVDAADAFRLVRTTAEETSCGCGGGSQQLRAITVELSTGDISVCPGGGAGGTAADIPEATPDSPGLLSSEDKRLLDQLRGSLDGQSLLATDESGPAA